MRRAPRGNYPRAYALLWPGAPVNPAEFAVKWMGSTRPERAASQEHFIDVCGMLDVPTPNQADPTGDWYAFEKGAEKLGGGDGFADAWMRDHFAWEYKGKRKDLAAAYLQLNEYREALDNPPLLIVCDLDRFEVHTNFTGTAKVTHRFTLADLAASPDGPLRVLRAAFTDPESLRPTRYQEELTEKAAQQFAELAAALRSRGHEALAVANFLDRMVFTMFAEDAGLLPKGILERLAQATRREPDAFSASLGELFSKMATAGGLFGVERVDWFNGGLFEDSTVLPLTTEEIETVRRAAALNWSQIEPAIFGTLFERGLDPEQRSQLGAHYTDRASILKLVEPVLMAPLRRDYAEMQVRVTALVKAGRKLSVRTPAQDDPRRVFRSFLERLRATRVLDPACGSGSFLYVVLQLLKDLERDALAWGSLVLQKPQEFPEVGPHNLVGLEINPYAAELARVTIWIGELQWMLANGFSYRRNPILQPLHNIIQQDALLDLSDPTSPREAEWPDADVVVGNPPFLGAKLLRAGLRDSYVESLYKVYGSRLPGMSDLCAYWHEKARAQIQAGKLKRAGLLATQGIRGGRGGRVLEKINESGAIFFAYADEPWVLSGAAVHISFIGQDDGSEKVRTLDGKVVASVNSDLTTGADLRSARSLSENKGIAFIPDVKGGPFDIDEFTALRLLRAPNPDGRANADVVRPWVNGLDVTRRPRHMWIIDFGVDLTESEAALYEAPFEYVREHVRPERAVSRTTELDWWIHERPGHSMRAALAGLSRYIATPETSKHRLFVWLPSGTLADHALVVFASEDDYLFGVLQSRIHERWSLAVGTQLETRPRYTPTTCLEKFPFPQPTHDQRNAIAKVARDLDHLRNGWLNPPGLLAAELQARTLTNLYNERPAWLANLHEDLDEAVIEAYGWPADLDDDSILGRLLKLNLERARASG